MSEFYMYQVAFHIYFSCFIRQLGCKLINVNSMKIVNCKLEIETQP